MTPKLTVIMPVYNAADHIRPAIDSILNQSFTDFEFLIIDDASTDDTVPIIQSYNDERIVLHRNECNTGSLISRNKLMEVAKGEFIAFQDGDDISEPDKLEKQIKYLESKPDVALCGTFYKAIDERGNPLKDVILPTGHSEIRQEFKKRCPIVFSTSMIRKYAYEQIGGFREYFKDKGNYDFDWMSRISEQFKVGNVPAFLYYRRILSTSNSKAIVNPDKIFGDRTVCFLQSQREADGKDALMGYKVEEFEEFLRKNRAYIQAHPQYYYHWQMHIFMSYGMYKGALINSLRAIKAKPTVLQSYRDSFYILRKILFS